MHAYNSDNADLLVNHLGLHKALCVLMGWNHSKPPDNSKSYQLLPVDEAAANQEDLIIWPPVVMIHNTITGKSKDGRMEGLGNKVMDAKIRGIVYAKLFQSSSLFLPFLLIVPTEGGIGYVSASHEPYISLVLLPSGKYQ